MNRVRRPESGQFGFTGDRFTSLSVDLPNAIFMIIVPAIERNSATSNVAYWVRRQLLRTDCAPRTLLRGFSGLLCSAAFAPRKGSPRYKEHPSIYMASKTEASGFKLLLGLVR